MIKIICLLAILTTSAHAKLPLINFYQLSGEYAHSKGTAFAESAKYDISSVRISHKDIDVQFNKQQKHLVLRDDTTTVELKFDFSFLNVFRAVNFSGVDLVSTTKKFNAFFNILNVYIDPNEYRVREVDVEVDVSHMTDIGDDIDVLDGFMINGNLNIGEIRFGSINTQNMKEAMIADNPGLIKQINKLFTLETLLQRIPLIARNLTMMVRKKTFSGRVKLDSWINLNLYLGGEIYQVKKENKLIIDLLKAKLGYFSIRKWILRSISNLNVENITLDGTKIIIDLGKNILASRR